MKKPTLNFGSFKQFDKAFITSEKGVDPAQVTSVAFCGESLYIAHSEGVSEYADGKLKKLSFNASKLFSVNGSSRQSFKALLGQNIND